MDSYLLTSKKDDYRKTKAKTEKNEFLTTMRANRQELDRLMTY